MLCNLYQYNFLIHNIYMEYLACIHARSNYELQLTFFTHMLYNYPGME